jgi:hypothetical protein
MGPTGQSGCGSRPSAPRAQAWSPVVGPEGTLEKKEHDTLSSHLSHPEIQPSAFGTARAQHSTAYCQNAERPPLRTEPCLPNLRPWVLRNIDPSSRLARPSPRSIARDHDTNPSRPPRNRVIRPSPLFDTPTSHPPSTTTADPSPACPSRASCKTCRSARAAPCDGPPAARRPSRPSTTAHPAPRTSRAPCPTPAPPPRA